jgi:hypothetical protein
MARVFAAFRFHAAISSMSFEQEISLFSGAGILFCRGTPRVVPVGNVTLLPASFLSLPLAQIAKFMEIACRFW